MWQHWIRYIRNFFGFTRSEARGFSFMALLLILAYTGWFIYRLLPTAPYEPLADQQQLDSLIAILEAADTVADYPVAGLAAQEVVVPQELFPFNPNSISHDSLLRLGFSPQLARRMVNYREKGGRFRKKEDLQKLYGLPQELYQTLEPWVRLPAQQTAVYRQQSVRAARESYPERAMSSEKFDLNTADSLQLLSVRGIGPVLSGRILKFRNALGGFVQAEQVREVWGLPSETADVLLERAYVAPDVTPKSISINSADVAELASHPYMSRKQAGWIVAYRTQHGAFQQASDLLKIHQLDKSFVEKLTPYLSF